MNKGEFASFMAEKLGCTKAEAERIINAFCSTSLKALEMGEDISLVGYGKFSVREVAARTGRNPKTGQPIEIPRSKQPSLKFAQKVKDDFNKRGSSKR